MRRTLRRDRTKGSKTTAEPYALLEGAPWSRPPAYWFCRQLTLKLVIIFSKRVEALCTLFDKVQMAVRGTIAKNHWRVNCAEHWFPGLWRRWFFSQCVAVGGAPPKCRLEGASPFKGWSLIRNCLKRMHPEDKIVVQLRSNRIARVGAIVRLAIGDVDWRSFVPIDEGHPRGEMGRYDGI